MARFSAIYLLSGHQRILYSLCLLTYLGRPDPDYVCQHQRIRLECWECHETTKAMVCCLTQYSGNSHRKYRWARRRYSSTSSNREVMAGSVLLIKGAIMGIYRLGCQGHRG